MLQSKLVLDYVLCLSCAWCYIWDSTFASACLVCVYVYAFVLCTCYGISELVTCHCLHKYNRAHTYTHKRWRAQPHRKVRTQTSRKIALENTFPTCPWRLSSFHSPSYLSPLTYVYCIQPTYSDNTAYSQRHRLPKT